MFGWFTLGVRSGDVFELLKDGRPRTRADLVAETGLARSTIAARVEALMQLGLVAPYGDGVSTGGRRPSLLAMDATSWLIAGVDIGASHARAVIANLSGDILGEQRADLDVALGPEHVLGWVTRVIEDLIQELGRTVGGLAAVGIGLPGPVEHSTGRAINPPIMPGWDRFDVPGHVQRRLPVPVLVDNDVNIMALGERAAHLPTVDDITFVKVSTGIGAGLISGGVLQRGAEGTAGDLGHVQVAHAVDVQCRCGNTGCLEAIAAGPALARRLRDQGVEAEVAGDVVGLIRAGDLGAVQVVRQAGRDLGEVLAVLVNLTNPSVIVIGGVLAEAGESLLAGIREVVYQRSLPLATQHLRIVASQAGERAGVFGAVAIAIDHVLSPDAIDRAIEGAMAAPIRSAAEGRSAVATLVNDR